MAEFVELKQRHIEGWVVAIADERPEDWQSIQQLPIHIYNGVSVRAAVTAGWFADAAMAVPENGTADDVVGDMKPTTIDALAARVWEAYQKATTIDPN